MPQISLVIITYNEEKNIGRCLDSVQDVADDIVVVDSFSTDRTEEICLQRGARFVKNPFKGHIEQKNFAITQAKFPHVLSLDADEALSDELRRSILAAKNDWKYDGYFMNRLTNYCGQWIHHCSWYPDRKLRLFDSRKGSWQGINPHDEYKLHQDEPTGRLHGDLLHYSYFSIKGHIDQINKFSDIAAQSLYSRGKRAHLLKVVFGPFWTFIRNYFIKLGFLDGFYGFIICMISAHATFLKYAKLKQLYLFASHHGLGVHKIIISRTDAIGDVVLTLPMCGVLKSQFPELKIAFFGRSYTKDVIDTCAHIDEFLNYDEFEKLDEETRVDFLRKTNADAIIHVFPKKKIAKAAKKAKIRLRIGTSSRLHHWLYCNKLVALSRRNSINHETQLNLLLLYSFGIEATFPLNRIHQYYGLKHIPDLPEKYANMLNGDKINIIIHPKSRGNGREWGLDNFRRLIEMMPAEKYQIFVSGTKAEKEQLNDWLITLPKHVVDLTDQLNLRHFIAFIAKADGLVASGTGPLHLAAALGVNTLGIFPPLRPIHPGRWAPVGPKADYVCEDKICNDCISGQVECACVRNLPAAMLYNKITAWESSTVHI